MLQGKPKAREPRWRRQDLARVKRLSSERVCARLPSPRAPPLLPASLRGPRSSCAPPGGCGGRFPGTFQESTSRDRGPRFGFKEAPALMRKLQGRRAQSGRCGARRPGRLGVRPPSLHSFQCSQAHRRSVPATAVPTSASGACTPIPRRACCALGSEDPDLHPPRGALPLPPSPRLLDAPLPAAHFVSAGWVVPDNGPSRFTAQSWSWRGPFLGARARGGAARRRHPCPGPRRRRAGGKRRLLKQL